MDLYPVKKLLKEQRDKDRAFTFNETMSHKSRSQASSPTNESFAKYEASYHVPYSPLRYSDNGQRRFDLAYTLSFCNKQQEKRVDNQVKSPSKLDPSLKNVSTTFSGGSMTTTTLTPSNRRYVVHLSSQKDQDFYKVPLYQNNIYHIRDKNEKRLQQILNSKEEYQRDYNRIAARNHFAKFRSGSNVTVEKKHRRHNSTTMPENTSNILIHNDEVVDTHNSVHEVQDKWERDSRSFHHATFQGEVTQSATLTSGLGATFQQRSESGNNRLLDGLEEIYQQDLSRNDPKEKNIKASLDMKNKSRRVKKEKGANHSLNLQNYKDYYDDGRLMDKLKDPYAKKLPFEKPLNGNIRNHKVRELAAIETKAEVLRNIKLIEESMRREISNMTSPTVKLPQIRDRSKESVKGEEDNYSDEQIKQLKKSTLSVPSPARGRSPRSKNHILASYVGRNKL